MKPRRTPHSNACLDLPGGNEDNSLWVETTVEEATGAPVILSAWELNDEERAAIAAGAKVYLLVWGTTHPPVAMGVEGCEP